MGQDGSRACTTNEHRASVAVFFGPWNSCPRESFAARTVPTHRGTSKDCMYAIPNCDEYLSTVRLSAQRERLAKPLKDWLMDAV